MLQSVTLGYEVRSRADSLSCLGSLLLHSSNSQKAEVKNPKDFR